MDGCVEFVVLWLFRKDEGATVLIFSNDKPSVRSRTSISDTHVDRTHPSILSERMLASTATTSLLLMLLASVQLLVRWRYQHCL